MTDKLSQAMELLREGAPFRVWHNHVNKEIRSDGTGRRIATFHKTVGEDEAKLVVRALNAFLSTAQPDSANMVQVCTCPQFGCPVHTIQPVPVITYTAPAAQPPHAEELVPYFTVEEAGLDLSALVTDEVVRTATSVFFMQMAGDCLKSNDSIEAWHGCMRATLRAAAPLILAELHRVHERE